MVKNYINSVVCYFGYVLFVQNGNVGSLKKTRFFLVTPICFLTLVVHFANHKRS